MLGPVLSHRVSRKCGLYVGPTLCASIEPALREYNSSVDYRRFSYPRTFEWTDILRGLHGACPLSYKVSFSHSCSYRQGNP